MACPSPTQGLRPDNIDDGKVQGPRAPPSRSLRGRKLVVIKVEPSYISSDLFTPFSEPRATLPSIAEFVRPSYRGDRTWGTVTSSYGGVGPASQQLKKRGCGSISRSHRHYGSGCINYYNFEEGDLGYGGTHKSKRLNGGDLELNSDLQTEDEQKNHHVPVTMETASALKDVQASLYGTSSYNEDFASIMSAFQRRQAALPALIPSEVAEPSMRELQRKTDTPSYKEEELCHKENEANEEEEFYPTSSSDDSSGKDSELEETSSDTNTDSHGHMICTSDGSTVLPDHVIITDLLDLPTHFRRVTTKYTRNRCPMFPCQVPFYLWRNHQLLPSAMTSLPAKVDRSKDTTEYLPNLLNHQETVSLSKRHHYQLTRSEQDKKLLPKLWPVARKRPKAGTRMVSVETRLPQQHLRGVRRLSHMTQNLGLKFKSDAHTRYHTHFPDQVPELQPVEPSRRHTFFGYHTSVFRG